MKQLHLPSKQRGFLQAALGIGSIGASIFGAISGKKAAKGAARSQTQAANAAIRQQKNFFKFTSRQLAPFSRAGKNEVGKLTGFAENTRRFVNDTRELITDPNRQVDFIEKNPFFKVLADDAQRRLLSNQAARGKVGSGETAKALQNSLLLLGNDLLNEDVNRRNVSFNQGAQAFNQSLGISQLGANAAARVGNAAQTTGQNVSNLTTQKGNAQAAGQVGGHNAITGAINNAINTGAGLFDIASQNRMVKSATPAQI